MPLKSEDFGGDLRFVVEFTTVAFGTAHNDLKRGKKYNFSPKILSIFFSPKILSIFFQSKNCIFSSFKHCFGTKMDFFGLFTHFAAMTLAVLVFALDNFDDDDG